MKIKRKINKKEIFNICKSCETGACCRDGVEVDLKEAKKISRLALNLKRPWFEDLSIDKELPSGWRMSTVIRNGRCVFQRNDYKCVVYKHRPKCCRDFPIENKQIAQMYDYLCEKQPRLKRKVKRLLIPDFSRSSCR